LGYAGTRTKGFILGWCRRGGIRPALEWYWCSILELVRTHFSGKIPPRIRQLADGKAAEPHR